MRHSLIAIAALGASACMIAPPPPHVASPDWTGNATFTPMGAATGSGAFSATLDGSTATAAPYTIRVHMKKDGRILPHTHPDARLITVVDGDLCYGFGDTFDPDGCKIYKEGSFFVVPANAPHYGFGRIGDAVYQESGIGPSGFNLVRAPAK